MGSAASLGDGDNRITSQREGGSAKTRLSRRWAMSLELGVSSEDLKFKLHYYVAISLVVEGGSQVEQGSWLSIARNSIPFRR